MGQLTTKDISKRLKSPIFKRAQRLSKEGRVYRVNVEKSSVSALVLSDLQPERVSAFESGDVIQFTCTCLDQGPCVHVLSLVLNQSERFSRSIQDVLVGKLGQNKYDSANLLEATLFDLDAHSDLSPQSSKPQREQKSSKQPRPGDDLPSLFDFDDQDSPPEKPRSNFSPVTIKPRVQEAVASPDRDLQPWRRDAQSSLDEGIIYEELEPHFTLHLNESSGLAHVRLSLSYGGILINPADFELKQTILGTKTGFIRSKAKEDAFKKKLRDLLSPYLAFERGYYAVALGNDSPDFGLSLSLTEFLTDMGPALIGEGFDLVIKGRRVLGGSRLSVQCKNEGSWFDVEAHVVIEADASKSYPIISDESNSLPGFVATSEGFVSISKRDIERLEFLRRSGLDSHGVLHTTSLSMSLIEILYEEAENREIKAVSEGYKALSEIRAIQDLAYHAARTGDQDIPPDIDVPDSPRSLDARLRTYQQLGFAWLKKLHQYGFGACLADDMGLGKTVQTLALLASLKEESNLSASLLVAPVVTLGNWEAEITKFLPSLRFVRHQGNRRLKDAQELRQYDLVIVSYQTLRNDLDLFASHEWDLVILDEAHYIKTASSQIFKAIRSISGRHRISLTGTPIENNSGELWAQFSFLNPGLLGSQKDFYEQYSVPIERKSDDSVAQNLRDLVHPYILRRKKQDVLSELPDKIDTVELIEMDTEQANIYELHRRRYQEIVNGLLDTQGLEQSRIEVFKYILRLRQLAIMPVLANPDLSHVPSAKLEALTLMLEDLESSDNKVLIFSQFTRTLDIIAERLKERDWQYSMLTGQTANREAVIESFKTDPDKKIFLLSLKAGGVGINLTQANYVVLFDPWWNPAAESQAIDRAYRLGQSKKVSAYRFIAKNTIEEKILALQERKQLLSEVLVGTSGAALSLLDDKAVRNLFSGVSSA